MNFTFNWDDQQGYYMGVLGLWTHMTHEKAFVRQTGMEPVLQATWSCWSAPWGTRDRKTCCWTANALHCGPCERLHHLFFGLQIHKVLRIPALPQELRWNPAVFWRHNFDIAKPRNGINAKNVIVTHWHIATILQPYWNHIETIFHRALCFIQPTIVAAFWGADTSVPFFSPKAQRRLSCTHPSDHLSTSMNS